MELHKSDKQQWVVIDNLGMVQLFSMKTQRSISINRFVAVWDQELPSGKWSHWYNKGYRCIKVELTLTQTP